MSRNPLVPRDTDHPRSKWQRDRILDANANRASEGLRVVEDFLRFKLNDELLTGVCKRARHTIGDLISRLPSTWESRDVAGDLGRELTTPQEFQRKSESHVLRANLNRVQQALRSLEEWSKLSHPEISVEFERVRYQVYQLEACLERLLRRQHDFHHRWLYVLVDGGRSEADFTHRIQQLLTAQVDLIQFRDKSLNDRDLLVRAHQLCQLTHSSKTLAIINDRPDIAVAVGADGVHLGQDDLPIDVARQITCGKLLIGRSTHSVDQAEAAVRDGADYLGVGPTFPSQTKSFDQFPGIDLVTAVASLTTCPAFAIGGIDATNFTQVQAAGLHRVAVGAAVWHAKDLTDACDRFRKAKQRNTEHAP